MTSPDDIFEFVSLDQAEEKQRELSWFVKAESEPGFNPTLVCGLDTAYVGNEAVTVAAVWDMNARRTIEQASLCDRAPIDYLPGFLGFREGKLLAGAIDRLHARPDVFLVDGHGKAHPRRFGLACHLGLAISRPTIGVAKANLYGNIDGETIFDLTGEVIGVIASTNLAKRYFVSIGNNIGLDDAKELVQRCTVNNYIAPLRAAHSEAVRQIRDLE